MPSSLRKRGLSLPELGSNTSSSKRMRISSLVIGASGSPPSPSFTNEHDASLRSRSSAIISAGSARTGRPAASRSDWMATVVEAAPCSHTVSESNAEPCDSGSDTISTTGATLPALDVASVFRHSLSPTRYVFGATVWGDLAHELSLAERAGYDGHAADVIDTALTLGVECLPDDITLEFCPNGAGPSAENTDTEACGDSDSGCDYAAGPPRITVADVRRWRAMNTEDIRAEVVAAACETSSAGAAELEAFVSVWFPPFCAWNVEYYDSETETEIDGGADDYEYDAEDEEEEEGEEDDDFFDSLDDAELDEELCGERTDDAVVDGDNISAAVLQVVLGAAYNNSLEAQEFVNGAILGVGAGGGDGSEDELAAILAEGVVDRDEETEHEE